MAQDEVRPAELLDGRREGHTSKLALATVSSTRLQAG
jgi:hypothetical protein